MTYTYQPADPHTLVQRITEDAYCIMEMQEDAQELTEEANRYLTGLALIGKAWDIQPEVEEVLQALADFVQDRDMEMPQTDIAVPLEECILTELWGLFDTAARLEDREAREEIRQLAQQVMEFHGLDMRVQDL